LLSLEQEITGEFPEPGNLPPKKKGNTDTREEQADHDQQFAYIGKIEHFRVTSMETKHRSCNAAGYAS
jgi:hypothetical protein